MINDTNSRSCDNSFLLSRTSFPKKMFRGILFSLTVLCLQGWYIHHTNIVIPCVFYIPMSQIYWCSLEKTHRKRLAMLTS